MKKITVAVIDDGVKLEDMEDSAKRFEGWYMDTVPPPHGKANAWYYSSEGHGTEMVRIIRKVCPHAHFFICNLDKPTQFQVRRCVGCPGEIDIGRDDETGLTATAGHYRGGQ
jgi:hypothetical protein